LKAKSNNPIESSKPKNPSFEHSVLSLKLNIGYDGKRAANNVTGLGNYSRSLIEHLAKQFTQHQYFIYTPKIKEKLEKLPLFGLPNINLKLPLKAKFMWRIFGIKKQLLRDGIDIFHGLSHEIPFGLQKTGIKSIVTIHDLIFLRKPHYYKLIDRLIYKWKSKYACGQADKIIAISEKTKQDIIEFYKTNPNKIEVIYQSCDDSFKISATEKEKLIVKEKYQLPTNYLLSVGSIEERKNLLIIIKALPKINNNFKLVVIGKTTDYTKKVNQEIEKLGLQNRVVFLKNIPFSDLPSIYQMARVFIYPSLYEGFGIPVIEALYSKVPVVAATGSCLEEAGGPTSKYVSPNNAIELANAVNAILNDEKLQKKMAIEGIKYVQKFDNKIVSEQLIQCYLNL
jgi:glycosyltransferase involved in cell wall biosynthesis